MSYPLPSRSIQSAQKPLWDLSLPEIERWIRSLAPGVVNTGGMLFPKPPTLAPDGSQDKDKDAIMKQYQERYAVGNLLIQNMTRALGMASDTSGGDPAAKKTKIANLESKQTHGKGDVYNILDPSFSKQNNTVSEGEGAILSRLTLGGLVNALAGTQGGVVDTVTCVPLSDLNGKADVTSNGTETSSNGKKKGLDANIDTAGNLTLKELIRIGSGLHRSVSARTEMDVMSTTPRRIADLFCPEISMSELSNIRQRIHSTVVMGMGTNSSAHAASLEDEEKEIPVAQRVGRSEVEQWQRCSTCNNNDQALFILDRKNGDLICTSCGTVVSESIMHEGEQFRKFEGELDRNHHGDAPNPLFSNSHNMSTTLGGVTFQSGAGMGGYGSGGKRNIENVLRNAHTYTEMNISQFGKDEKKTRIGYKDRQKKDAFYQMAHAGDALGLHEAVVQRAKELFAGFRDDREMVQQFKGVLAACLCEAFDQLSKDGRQILKKRAGEVDTKTNEEAEEEPKIMHVRASKRNELHSASLAGKGGLLLDTTAVSHGGIAGGALNDKSTRPSTGLPFETKLAATWDLDDCRSWLMESSKSIAKIWSEAHKNASADKALLPAAADTNIPKGTKDELEGKLVEHTLKLCEFLESELKAASGGKSNLMGSHQKVKTPRVADMAKLGIKWQHSYERGSGGKGGVGNSGNTIYGTKPGQAPRSGRTAGQILLLLTAKKFGIILQDPVAGAAFHKELKTVLSREDANKRNARLAEATQARLKQMNRKPWLQKRVS